MDGWVIRIRMTCVGGRFNKQDNTRWMRVMDIKSRRMYVVCSMLYVVLCMRYAVYCILYTICSMLASCMRYATCDMRYASGVLCGEKVVASRCLKESIVSLIQHPTPNMLRNRARKGCAHVSRAERREKREERTAKGRGRFDTEGPRPFSVRIVYLSVEHLQNKSVEIIPERESSCLTTSSI